MNALRHLFNPMRKTKEDLIGLYAKVVKEKAVYQYDPKKVILDLFPYKRALYTVFIPKKEYSLSQAIEDYGCLEMREYRFINFLKFTEFTAEEIELIFKTHNSLVQAKDTPELYRYSIKELFRSIDLLSSADESKKTDEKRKDVRALQITSKELDELYS